MYRLKENKKDEGRKFPVLVGKEGILAAVVTLDSMYRHTSMPPHLQTAREFAEKYLLPRERIPLEIVIVEHDGGMEGYDAESFRKMKLTEIVPVDNGKNLELWKEKWGYLTDDPTEKHLEWICYGFTPNPMLFMLYTAWLKKNDRHFRNQFVERYMN
jgi:hypothetical protein